MKFRKCLFILATVPALLVAPVWADPSVSARVSNNNISLNETITLEVQVAGISNVEPPGNFGIPNFQVQPAGQSQSFQWINGQTSSITTFIFVLQPTQAGTLTIPSISLPHEGKTYNTEPITVVVRPDGTPASAAAGGTNSAVENSNVPTEGLKPVFMTASVDKSKVYVGQQIILKVQFLRRPNIQLASQPRYVEPDMTGFVVEPLKQQENTTTINGSPYVVTELKYALFPTSDGDFAIGNARIDMQLRTPADPFDPNSFFQNFFSQNQTSHVETRAIPINVRALPKNKPNGFSGAVGRFKISARLENENTVPEVGKPINLLVKIEGVGNVKALKDPAIPELKSFRRYETISSVKTNNEGNFIFGSKEFKILLIPLVSGAVTIPSIPLVTFDPDQRDYVTDATRPIDLNVKPGTLSGNMEPGQVSAPSGPDQSSEGIHVVEKDIRFIKQGSVFPLSQPIHSRSSFIVLNALPPVFAFAAFIAVWRTRRRSLNVGYYRAKDARGRARRTLKRAEKLLAGDPTSFYSALHNAVAGFLADKFGLSASGILWDDLDRRLVEKGVDSTLKRDLRDVFDAADLARFATSEISQAEMQASFDKAFSAIDQLEKTL